MDRAQLRRWQLVENYAETLLVSQPSNVGFFGKGPMQERPTFEPLIAKAYSNEIDTSQRLLLDLPTSSM